MHLRPLFVFGTPVQQQCFGVHGPVLFSSSALVCMGQSLSAPRFNYGCPKHSLFSSTLNRIAARYRQTCYLATSAHFTPLTSADHAVWVWVFRFLHVGDFAYNFDSDGGLLGDQFMRNIEQVAGKASCVVCVICYSCSWLAFIG
jgi:hypothetical protein